MRYADSAECRDAGVTYHLVPTDVWGTERGREQYIPAAFDQDGFIHCTNGLDKLVEVGNMFYKEDTRPYLVLILDVSKIKSPVRYDDPDETFPHIYGPLNTDAVIGMLDVRRGDDGTFLPFPLGADTRT